VSQAGAVLLLDTVRAVGLDRELSSVLAPWRKPLAVHDPAKVLCDLAVMLVLGGDCLADVALLREAPDVFGRVASDPTVSRLIDTLAADPQRALGAIGLARAKARRAAWSLAGEHAPNFDLGARTPLVVDLDATLITAAQRSRTRGRRLRRALAITRCGRSPTTGPRAPVSRWRCCCALATRLFAVKGD